MPGKIIRRRKSELDWTELQTENKKSVLQNNERWQPGRNSYPQILTKGNVEGRGTIGHVWQEVELRRWKLELQKFKYQYCYMKFNKMSYSWEWIVLLIVLHNEVLNVVKI